MLFNSHVFLFAFLPVTLLGSFALAGRGGGRAALVWLLAASLFFYAWWNPPLLGLLLASIGFNYAIGWALCRGGAASPGTRRLMLALGIGANLMLLVQCKYLNFFTRAFDQATGAHWPLPPIFLPLAISFFTFQQIAFLVEAHRGRVPSPDPLRYALFVSFFPQLIAGPIVQHDELLPQLADRRLGRFSTRNLAIGLTLLVLGLFKKVVIADGVAAYSDPVFGAAAAGTPVAGLDAWCAALAYSFQIYFDFSGYSDMAIGLGAMFGVRLPINFDSPYKAASIVEFWRRWHITLSRFLRDHLYIPLGGNRHGRVRRHLNLAITMLLGGLWHGAGWTFVIWGGLHGAYLMLNHGCRALCGRLGLRAGPARPVTAAASRLLTFLAVVMAWVFFRAETLPAALALLRPMLGLAPGGAVGAAGTALLSATPEAAAVLVLLCGLVWCFPNSLELVREAAAPRPGAEPRPGRFAWAPTPAWGLTVGLLGLLAVADMVKHSEFIYFRF